MQQVGMHTLSVGDASVEGRTQRASTTRYLRYRLTVRLLLVQTGMVVAFWLLEKGCHPLEIYSIQTSLV